MKKFLPYVLVGLAVYMARDQIGKLPLISKLPTL